MEIIPGQRYIQTQTRSIPRIDKEKKIYIRDNDEHRRGEWSRLVDAVDVLEILDVHGISWQ